MKKQIIINIETEYDDEMIKTYLIYSLRVFSIKKEDIEIHTSERRLKENE